MKSSSIRKAEDFGEFLFANLPPFMFDYYKDIDAKLEDIKNLASTTLRFEKTSVWYILQKSTVLRYTGGHGPNTLIPGFSSCT